jgi:hypothetical protein
LTWTLRLLQFIITLTSLAENVYSITKPCRWLSTTVIVLRTVAWTAWNGIFLSMLVRAVLTLRAQPRTAVSSQHWRALHDAQTSFCFAWTAKT